MKAELMVERFLTMACVENSTRMYYKHYIRDESEMGPEREHKKIQKKV